MPYQHLTSLPQTRRPFVRSQQPAQTFGHIKPPRSSFVVGAGAPELRRSINGNIDQTQYSPYPGVVAQGYSTPHPNITIEPVSTAHIPSLSRIAALLLPVRYPNSFYTATVTDPIIASLSRVAVYHDHHNQHLVSSTAAAIALPATASIGLDKVIGGIRCRLERLPPSAAEQPATNLYIQTLHLLSPYRGHGVAASLLNSLLFDSAAQPGESGAGRNVSELVRHYNIRTVTAHVHEANDDALHWYCARGFTVDGDILQNYYSRLCPSGARVVKLVLQWNDQSADASITTQGSKARPENEDDDWEKVEAEDVEEYDHGVQSLPESKAIDLDDGRRKKRKTDG